MLAENLARVQQRIQQVCERRGRDPSSVTLVCVTKGIPLETIREVVALGAAELGENRVQEAAAKITAVADARVRWHLIGHLQRNKANDAAGLFDAIHSIDSLALAEALERHAAARARTIEAFVQVNVSGEPTKFGCAPDEAVDLAQRVRQHPHLRLRGFMTLAPFMNNPEDTRPYFRQLRQLRDHLASTLNLQPSTLNLSMGMSQDFEVAIEEGADLVRIGTAIFGHP